MAENEQELILEQQNSGKYMFFTKNRLTGDNEKLSKYKNIIQNITSASATTELVNLLGGKYFDHPKPVKLVKILVDIGLSDNDIVLDFFSGSATTAHAVMQLNAEDGGNRQFICVQLPELCDEKSEAFKAGYFNICEIGKERIRRAGAKIGQGDTGFKVFKLDTSNLAQWDNTPLEEAGALFARLHEIEQSVKPDRTAIDVVYEVMLKLGIPLDYPIQELQVNDKKAYSIGTNCLVLVCIDYGQGGITPEDIEEMCKYLPAKIVSTQQAFKDDVALSNAHYILKDRNIEIKLL